MEGQGDGDSHVADEGQRLWCDEGRGSEAKETEIQHVIEPHAEEAVIGFNDL